MDVTVNSFCHRVLNCVLLSFFSVELPVFCSECAIILIMIIIIIIIIIMSTGFIPAGEKIIIIFIFL